VAETVKVPGISQPLPKWAVWGGLGGVGIAIFLYYRNRNKAAPAATPANQYPPDGTVGNPSDPYSTDPATGQTYGDEATGSGGTLGAYTGGSTYGDSGIIGYDSSGSPVYAPGYGPSGGGGSYQTPGGPPFSSNSAWSDWVLQELQAQNPGVDAGALTDALGLYIEGQPVDPAQAQLVFDARAIAGDPPVAGPNGYPPNLRLNGGKGGPPPTPPPGTGGKPPAPGGLHVEYISASSTRLGWNLVHGATRYTVRYWPYGSTERLEATSPASSVTLTGLRPGTRYEAHVSATGPSGTGPSGPIVAWGTHSK
jgi:Fibronectin type III domain